MEVALDFLKSNWLALILSGVGVWTIYKILRNPRFYWNVFRTLPRDLGVAHILFGVKRTLAKYERKNYAVFQAFDEIVAENPCKKFLFFEDHTMTAEQVQELSYRIANFFQSKGLKKGDSVGIFMDNCAEYVALWLGLSRIGVVPALINYNLRLKPLKHCIEAVNCKALIFNPALADGVSELLAEEGPLSGLPSLYYFIEGSSSSSTFHSYIPECPESAENLNLLLAGSANTPPITQEKIEFGDRVMYIFTSGTTGLPKASIIKHSRLFLMGTSCYYISKMRKDDVLYTSLPLYHGSGTMLGTCVSLIFGPGQVIRKKFSASAFWKDCIKYNATVAQYIGETCRYLVSQPETEFDRKHSVRAMYGNGLRPEVWSMMLKRFGIQHIGEFYGSTEGNCGMANVTGKIGAVGFTPIWSPNALPIRLIQVDEETGEVIRDPKTGFVKRCDFNEPGELVGRIVRNNPIADFEGYADKSSTQGKILTNAFRKGDAWFRSGDVLMQDEHGYFYFRDRKGDTFRWKGENCSTTEVESILGSVIGQTGVVVFGVEIPGCDGRAGMAVISDPDNSIDLNKLAAGMVKSLPAYARPLFVKLVDTELDMTGTYKLRKVEYQKAGYGDFNDSRIYFFNGKSFQTLDEVLYKRIVNGEIRV